MSVFPSPYSQNIDPMDVTQATTPDRDEDGLNVSRRFSGMETREFGMSYSSRGVGIHHRGAAVKENTVFKKSSRK